MHVTKISDSMLGETAKSAPKERRNYPGSHADLAGCGSETEWDIPCKVLLQAESQGKRGQRELPVPNTPQTCSEMKATWCPETSTPC